MSWSSRLCSSLGLTEDIGMVLLSERLLVFAMSDVETVVEVPLLHTPPVPPMPPGHLPDEVRDGLTTRVHLSEFHSEQPIFVRSEMTDCESTEELFKEAIQRVTTPRSRFVKPQVLICVPYDRVWVHKTAIINSLERAGARKVYLVETGMASAIGAGLDILAGQVHGVLMMESDWSVFTAISYADQLTVRFIPLGARDLPVPSASSALRDQMLNAIASALSELREPQMKKLAETGVYCLGQAATPAWTAAMSEAIGVPCRLAEQAISTHPAVLGMRKYFEHLEE